MKKAASAMIAALLLLGVSPTAMAQNAAQQQAASQDQKPPSSAPYRNSRLSAAERADDLLARMTLPEKVAQMLTLWDSKPKLFDANGQFVRSRLIEIYPNGLGMYARPSDVGGPVSPRVIRRLGPKEATEMTNALQRAAIEDTRLGIPMLFHEEGLHGLAAPGATSFPQAIALASSWDLDLIRRIYDVVALETRTRAVHLTLTPVVDIVRDPRWGRIEETYGEDPYLVSEIGVAAVEGLQGSGKPATLPDGKVFATLKHLTGHGQPESGTNIGPAPISERELRANFFPPFEQVIRRTGLSAVMPSYNEIDGVPSHANIWLLRDVLRGEWDFDGVVVSDYAAIDQMMSIHKIAATLDDAAVLAMKAGVDQDLPEGISYRRLAELVQSGRITQAQVDAAVRRILKLKFRAGLFENPYGDPAVAVASSNTPQAVELARVAAERSMILLKNDGMLPLPLPPVRSTGQPTIAVIGPNAAVTRLGGYYGEPTTTVSILQGVQEKLKGRARVVHAEGVKITEDDDWWADEVKLADPAENRRRIAEAVAVARMADTIILAIGDTEQTSREAWADSHLGDRDSLDLVGEQQELFDALKALGKPITVILINGRPASTVTIAEQANALIEGWYLGEQTGHAVANVLFGTVNPGGKLPVTIARNVGQLPNFYNHKPSARRGYLFDTTAPLFPFGHGLSYTSFDLSAPRLSASSIKAGAPVNVSVDVRNTGTRAGDEVVQIYVRDPLASVTRPVKELKGFQRITLAPGETRTVTLTLQPDAFALWNTDMKRVIEPGAFEIMAGSNSVDLKTVTLTVTQ